MEFRDKEPNPSINSIYCQLYQQKNNLILIAHLLQFFLAAVLILILALSINYNFIFAFIYLPVVLLFSAIQVIFMKKSAKSFPQYHRYYQLACFIVFFSTFLFLYLYIFNPTFKQTFNQGKDCKISKEQRAILEDDTYLENFQVITVQFTYKDEQFQGCGCGSDKNTESIFQTKIEPFRYISNEDMIALNVTTHVEDDDISRIKMPSWMCQPFKNYSGDLIDLDQTVSTGTSLRKTLSIEKCYFNIYGNENIALSQQEKLDYCTTSSNFIQIIFDQQPYYPPISFAITIVLTLFPIFGFSLNWVLVIILYLLFSNRLKIELKEDQQELPRNNINQNKVLPIHKQNSIDQNQKNDIDTPKQTQEKAEINNKYGEPQCVKIEDQKGQYPIIRLRSQSEKDYLEKNKGGENNADSSIYPLTDEVQNRHSSFESDGLRNKKVYQLPATKLQKKILPPIERDFNFENALRESIKQDLEHKRTHLKSIGKPKNKNHNRDITPTIYVSMEPSDYISSSQSCSQSYPTPILAGKQSASPQLPKKKLRVSFKDIDLQN